MKKYIPTKKDLYLAVVAATVGVLVIVLSTSVIKARIGAIQSGLSEAGSATIGIEQSFLVKKNLADYQNEVAAINAFFVNSGGEVVFIEKIEELARQSKVKIEIKSIMVDKKNNEESLVENLNLAINFEGEWKQVAAFLGSLERMPYAVELGAIEATLLSPLLWKGEVNLSVLKIKDA